MTTGMRELLVALDSALVAGITELSAANIKQLTEPFPTPTLEPMVYLVPSEPEKMKESNDTDAEVLWHRYPVRLIVWTDYRTTQEESLVHATSGLIKLMEDIETLLESNMLSGILQNIDISVVTYNLEERMLTDGHYARAGELLCTAETICYRSTISRS